MTKIKIFQGSKPLGSDATDVAFSPTDKILSANVQEAISEVAAKANTAQSTASSAVASAQSASVAAGNALVYAQSLTERLGQAEQTANNASATATSANNVAVAAAAEVANLRTQLNGKVGSTTITAIESITQSAYDTKKTLGELSDTTAYLITE